MSSITPTTCPPACIPLSSSIFSRSPVAQSPECSGIHLALWSGSVSFWFSLQRSRDETISGRTALRLVIAVTSLMSNCAWLSRQSNLLPWLNSTIIPDTDLKTDLTARAGIVALLCFDNDITEALARGGSEIEVDAAIGSITLLAFRTEAEAVAGAEVVYQ